MKTVQISTTDPAVLFEAEIQAKLATWLSILYRNL